MYNELKRNIGIQFPENCIANKSDLKKIKDSGLTEVFYFEEVEDIYKLLMNRYVLLKTFKENPYGIEDPFNWESDKVVTQVQKIHISDNTNDICINDYYSTNEYRIILIEDRLLQSPISGNIYKDKSNNLVMPLSFYTYIDIPIVCYVEIEKTVNSVEKIKSYYDLLELTYKNYCYQRIHVPKHLYTVDLETFNKIYSKVN